MTIVATSVPRLIADMAEGEREALTRRALRLMDAERFLEAVSP